MKLLTFLTAFFSFSLPQYDNSIPTLSRQQKRKLKRRAMKEARNYETAS